MQPDVDAGSPVVNMSVAETPVAEVDLTQFLAAEPSATTALVAEVVEKLGPITATDVGLRWWCPTGKCLAEA